MNYDIRISDAEYRRLKEVLWARPGIESAAFMLAGIQRTSKSTRILIRRVIEIPDTEYDVRSSYRIELSTRAVNGLAALCEVNGLIAVLAHSHPNDSPYSPSDDHGEARIAKALWPYMPEPLLGSLLMTPDRLHGRVWVAGSLSSEIVSQVSIVGRTVRTIRTADVADYSPTFAFGQQSRQILAFGEAGQKAMSAMRVVVVGVGGTGSSVAEQLARLGVKDIVLIDYDELDISNVSRVYGSTLRDSFRWSWLPKRLYRTRKVYVVAKYLRKIAPDVQVKAVVGNITDRTTAKHLFDRDVIFSCTDDHWGRSVINQISYQYLIPCINVGISIKCEDDAVSHGVGNVQLLRPDAGCLWCGGYLNSERIRAESLPIDERVALQKEGYLGDIDEPAPSVISLTTTVASLAVTWFIQLATDFAGSHAEYSRQNYDFVSGTVRRGIITPDPGCICARVRGRGDLEPLPF